MWYEIIELLLFVAAQQTCEQRRGALPRIQLSVVGGVAEYTLGEPGRQNIDYTRFARADKVAPKTEDICTRYPVSLISIYYLI